MKIGLTTVSIAVATVGSYKVTIVANDIMNPHDGTIVKTFLLDYNAGGIPLTLALADILRMVNEQLSR